MTTRLPSPFASFALFTLVIVALSACSSNRDADGPERVTTDEEINQAIEGIPAGAEALGLLTFFPGSDRGLVIKGIEWGRPLSSENPGADCELAAGGDDTYRCAVKRGEDTVSISVLERANQVLQVRISGRAAITRDRWVNQLALNGYTRQGQRAKEGSTRYYYASSDRSSRAELMWDPKAETVTVTLGPAPR